MIDLGANFSIADIFRDEKHKVPPASGEQPSPEWMAWADRLAKSLAVLAAAGVNLLTVEEHRRQLALAAQRFHKHLGDKSLEDVVPYIVATPVLTFWAGVIEMAKSLDKKESK